MSVPAAVQPVSANAAKRHRPKLVAAVALLLLFAVAFECTVRIEDLLRYSVPLGSSATSVADLVVRDAVGMHGRPGAAFEKWRINNVGTRGPDVDAIKPLGATRVIVVGASETFGLYESPGREFPRLLEQVLNAPPSPGTCAIGVARAYQVLNAALPGMTLPTIAQDIRLRLRALQPDVIVVYPTPVQYLDGRLPVVALPDSIGRAGVISPWAVLRPRSAERLRSALKSILHERVLDLGRRWLVRRARTSPSALVRFDSIPSERLSRFSSDLERLLAEVAESGASAVVVAHLNAFAPNSARDPLLLRAWERFYPQAAGAVIVAFDSAARPVTREVTLAAGATFVDASDAIEGIRSNAFADYAHFTDLGARAVAEAIAKGIDRPEPSGSAACRAASTPPSSPPAP